MMKKTAPTPTLLALVLALCISPLSEALAQEKRPLKSEPPRPLTARWKNHYSGKSSQANPKPDQQRLSELIRLHRPEGNWGGALCPSADELRSLVDTYLATPSPSFPGLGPTIPGASVSWSAPDCGTLNYAAGLRDVENNKQMTPATPMGIASMTKPIIAALTLQLNEAGVFGPNGLDTTVDRLLTDDQIRALTVGDDPLQPRCPGVTFLRNRDTFNFELVSFSCPDLSRVSLRDLMRSNHGMYDFLNEVLLPNGNLQYGDSVYFELYTLLGLDPVPPVSSSNGFDYLKAYGLKASNSATAGGNSGRDFEISLGNTGFQLLGIILESRTGKSLDELIRTMIVEPLGLDPINVYLDPNRRRTLIADGYDVFTGEPLIEQTGVYPVVNLNGHTAVNTLSFGLGRPGNINLAGGAGGLIANPKSYRVFLDSFVNGGLLGPGAQNDLDQSYLLIPDYSNPVVTIFNGFGIIKIRLRGFPGLGDVDIYQHGGSLPGVLCENAVVRAPESRLTLATGVICQNSNFNAFPDQFELSLKFINKFVEARDGNSQAAPVSAR
jgi:hypothetical protein